MTNFKTQYSPHDRVITQSGSKIKRNYQAYFDELGNRELKEISTENRYNYIQSFKDSVDIHVILKRFANGEADALTQRQGAYGDFTVMPKSYAELLNRVIDAENMFNSLPLDERAKYNHSMAEWLIKFDFNKASEQMKENISSGGSTPIETPVEKGEVKE